MCALGNHLNAPSVRESSPEKVMWKLDPKERRDNNGLENCNINE